MVFEWAWIVISPDEQVLPLLHPVAALHVFVCNSVCVCLLGKTPKNVSNTLNASLLWPALIYKKAWKTTEKCTVAWKCNPAVPYAASESALNCTDYITHFNFILLLLDWEQNIHFLFASMHTMMKMLPYPTCSLIRKAVQMVFSDREENTESYQIFLLIILQLFERNSKPHKLA